MSAAPAVVDVTDRIVPCAECGGTGRAKAVIGFLPHPCEWCDGYGVVLMAETVDEDKDEVAG